MFQQDLQSKSARDSTHNGQCQCLLKTGERTGSQCSNPAIDHPVYCGLHHNRCSQKKEHQIRETWFRRDDIIIPREVVSVHPLVPTIVDQLSHRPIRTQIQFKMVNLYGVVLQDGQGDYGWVYLLIERLHFTPDQIQTYIVTPLIRVTNVQLLHLKTLINGEKNTTLRTQLLRSFQIFRDYHQGQSRDPQLIHDSYQSLHHLLDR